MPEHRILPSPPGSWTWEALMREALHEAEAAASVAEVPVGAVVVDPAGAIIGRGRNSPVGSCDPTAHAEISALRAAAAATGNYRLTGCVLVVTLEPCQMCAGAVVHSRVGGLVYGARDPRAGAVDSGIESFLFPVHNHLPWHAGGILETECAAMLRAFFAARRGQGTRSQPR